MSNASNMNFAQMLSVDALYQVGIQTRTHGVGVVSMDSLNNARISLGLGYIFMKGTPEITFFDTEIGELRDFELSSYGHEAFVAFSVLVVKNWLAIGVTPKYQYSSLRYRGDGGVAYDVYRKLNTFGLDVSGTLHILGWIALSVTGTNLVGSYPPPYTATHPLNLTHLPAQAGSIDPGTLSSVSGYPLTVTHGLAIFPLHNHKLSLNFDGVYDFTTYDSDDYVRKIYGGSAEFVAGPVPIRAGAHWDSRSEDSDDDRVYVAGGLGFARPAKLGSVGFEVGVGFRQQVTGPDLETVLAFQVALLLHPDI